MKLFSGTKRKRNIRIALASILGAVILSISFAFVDKDFKIVKSLDIYYTLFRELSMYYVDDTDPEKLVKGSIDGMLETLDPYTVFISEDQLDDFDFMTTGKYGGIGAIVRKTTNGIVIVEPYEGLPAAKAGLKSGDLVRFIDGKEINGKDIEDVSELLKGDPKTKIELTVERVGVAKPINIPVVREKIAINSVMYKGMIDKSTGYIKISSFTEGSHVDVKNAFVSLKEAGATSLVLDLRENPGGLLNEAVSVVNLFVDKGVSIVNTKGKLTQFNSYYKTTSNPVDSKIPIVVLVNSSSASASEIVAGSLQDLDRAVIIGQRTFGKGLVQSTRLLSYNTKLKITTAKYYIPSGRCIQAVDYTHRRADGSVGYVPDSLIREFKTKGGRTVYDGGGVMPDIYLKPETYSKVTYALYSNYYFFDYATVFAQKHDTISSPAHFRLSDSEYDKFIEYLKSRNFDYQTESEAALLKLKNTIQRESYTEATKDEVEALTHKLKHNKMKDLDKYKAEIKQFLIQEIVGRYYYQGGRVRASLVDDPSMEKALNIIAHTDQYLGILNGTIKSDVSTKSITYDSDQTMEE